MRFEGPLLTVCERRGKSLISSNETICVAATRASTLPADGFVRLPSIIGPGGPIPVSKSTWWKGIQDGRYPQPVKLGPRITAWRVDDIRALIERGGRS
jgi:prophage regulatory protein